MPNQSTYSVPQTHANRLWWVALGILLSALLLGWAIAKGGLVTLGALVALPVGIAVAGLLIAKPRWGILLSLVLGFTAIGLTRYVPAPLGLSIDAVLAISVMGLFFHTQRQELPKLRNGLMVVIGIWFGYTLLQIFNPEARSLLAWFYAVRGVSLYLIMVVPLVMLCFHTRKDLYIFIDLWLLFSAIGALWGLRQLYVGLDGAEEAWLAAGNASTHILHGKLRVFSFYSDAGQFGAAQAHAGLVAAILALGRKRRLWYGLVALLCFYGMAISGTRGALFVPLAGFLAYFIVSKNIRILTLGFLLGGAAFYMLKFTYVGQSNYQIQRMRSALDPNDASLQVRLENQRKLSTYLASRPLGGGIGSAGYWGLRFSPGTFLAETPTDSWYVKIWAETGIIGLLVHLGMILYILIAAFMKVMRIRGPNLRQSMMALYAGVVGIALASYGNQVLGQMPTGIVVYVSMAFLFLAPKLDQQTEAN